ncbi:pseudouridine synthase [Elysia marginata]|uniref:Pseudouridine synthase n=1 Tax=Elysia marginata TaxID=1093978 RepID=A0AAV4I539_9GAST|nr:pseudouridine synthase [Elysia marginata]
MENTSPLAEIPQDEQDNGLYEHYRFDVADGQKPLRIDLYLKNFIESISRNKIQKVAENNSIWVNNEPVKANYKVRSGDQIKILFDHPSYEFLLEPEPIPLDITFEDKYLLVVNKPPDMVVHPGHGNYRGTLINGILYYLLESEDIPLNANKTPALVHRIDKDTSGLLVVAKTTTAMEGLAKQFFEKTSEREYIALVWGNVEQDNGTIVGNIGRHPKNRLQMTVFGKGDFGKEAVTHFEVLERFVHTTLISCRLETGRTHQIRVHLKHIGHTLFNDKRYGGDTILKGTVYSKYKQFVENCFQILPRQALHAKRLGFLHPITKEKMSFDSALPEDMEGVISKWRKYSETTAYSKEYE